MVYGEEGVVISPQLKEARFLEKSVLLEFDSIGSGLVAIDSQPLRHFEVSFEKGKFVATSATIVGNRVEVASPSSLEKPIAVRYAWSNNPENINFYNKEGFPVFPFEAISSK